MFADVFSLSLFFHRALYFIRLICYLVGSAGFWRLHTIFAYTRGGWLATRQCNGCRGTKRVRITRNKSTRSGWLVAFTTNSANWVNTFRYQLHLVVGNVRFVVSIITIFLIFFISILQRNFFGIILVLFAWTYFLFLDLERTRLSCSCCCLMSENRFAYTYVTFNIINTCIITWWQL